MLGFVNVFYYNAGPLWVLTLVVLPTIGGANKYCGEGYCNNSKQHTLCKYQSVQPATNCIEYTKIVTEEDKLAVLHKVNSRRNKVAAGELRSLPSAENMLKMEWSEELATSAQRWADQCVQHSVPDIKDSCRDLGSTPVGQNIATVYGEAPGLTAAALVDVWYTELLNLNASIIAHYQPSIEMRSTHYEYFTQLVWAHSFLVGCGGARFKQSSGLGRNQTVQRIVCNFAPAGNRVGEPVYSEGASCSQCHACDDLYTSLCLSEFKSTADMSPTTPTHGQYAHNYPDGQATSIPSQIEIASSSTEEKASTMPGSDELFPVFDYLSHQHKFTSQEITFVTEKSAPCKDILAIDELLELLKKKLSSDPAIKDLLFPRKYSDQIDNSFTDAGVAAFVSRLYSKKEITTTTKPVDKEYINSTLLADLVEAVIFRGGERYSVTAKLDLSSPYTHGVSPIRIQAELPKVKINNDFTGHYFFPEDDEQPSSTSREANEAEYYAVTEIPVADVVSELEDIKRNTEFKDFVDEILESETGTEAIVTTQFLFTDNMASYTFGKNNMNKFLEDTAEETDQIDSVMEISSSTTEANVFP